MVFQVHLAEDGKDFDALAARAAHAQPAGAQARLLGHRAERRDRPRDRRAVPLARRCSPARSARRRARTRPRSSPRSAFACGGTATSSGVCSARRACRAASTSAATTVAPATAPSTSARPPPRCSGRCCPRSSTASRRPPPRTTDVKKGTDALFTAENLQGLPAVFGGLGLLRDEKGKTVFRIESGPAEGGSRPHRGARELRRHGERPLPDRRVRQGAVRLGLRGRPPARAVAPARREDRGDQQGADDRRGHRRRGARHVLEQQPVPPGVVPAEEGHRVRGAGQGVRGLPRHLRQRGEGAECRRRSSPSFARRSPATRTPSPPRSRRSPHTACPAARCSKAPSAR